MAPVASSAKTAATWPAPPLSALPARLDTPDHWLGADMEKSTEWVVPVSPEVAAEVLAASRAFLASGKPLAAISRADFPLGPASESLLAAVERDLFHGRGFALLRGLPVDQWTKEETATATLGIGLRLGKLLVQNGKGHLLGHVQDLGRDPNDPTVRYYATAERQMFHTDEADVVGLVCLQTAAEGGGSLLASAAAVYNHLRTHDPAALETLFKPFVWDRKDEQGPGDAPYGVSPVLLYLPPKDGGEGRVAAFYDRNFLRSAARLPGVAPLTAEKTAALDALDAACEAVALRMDLQVGDVQLVHNHQLLHDRMAFRDGPGKRRHLLRLWLGRDGDREAWEVPEDLLQVRSTFGEVDKTAPLDAE
ncbi:taurine catabolism dioxygenase TauD, TfdA family [Hyaloraphidium curvatum]|nr:taurine catabolism dioxygenase TauD, TfdA family [Hyaloraphidium curvatum]